MDPANYPKVAVIGGGYWGPNLVRNFAEIGVLAGVCDLDAARRAELSGQYGVKGYASADEALADPQVGAVSLATPAVTHHDLARQALMAGKHVLVEKPLCLRSDQAAELTKLAHERGLTLMVGHLLLYHPAVLKLKAIVDAGDLGSIRHVRSSRLSLGRLRSEEDVLWSFAPHDLAVIDYLLADQEGAAEPCRIDAHGTVVLQQGIADVAYVDLAWESGTSAHVQVSWLEPVKTQRLVVVGDRRMAVFDDTMVEGKLRVYDRGFDPVARPAPEGTAAIDGAGNGRPGPRFEIRRGAEQIVAYPDLEPLREECLHFLDCAVEGTPPRSDGRHGERILRLLEAASCAMAAEREPAAPPSSIH